MVNECPECGGKNVEWADILGDAARPKGSVYDCHDCGAEFDSRDLLPAGVPKCPGCGFSTHAPGEHCSECAGGRA